MLCALKLEGNDLKATPSKLCMLANNVVFPYVGRCMGNSPVSPNGIAEFYDCDYNNTWCKMLAFF